MGLIIAAAILILLLFVPVGIRASYDRSGPFVFLFLGPFRFSLYSPKKNARNSADQKNSPKDDFESKKSNRKRTNGSLNDFIEILRFICDVLTDLRKKIVIDHLRLKLILAEEDPCDLSIHYGLGWAILGNITPHLERFFAIKKRQLEVACDYTADQIFVDAGIQFHLTVGRLLQFVIYHGARYFKKYYKHIKQFKGGATT